MGDNCAAPAVLVLVLLCTASLAPGAEAKSEDRETVLDRKVHIEENLTLDLPQVPPLCDRLKLSKDRVNVGDCELYCEQEGSGPPIVLLHGGPGATHHCFHPAFSQAGGFARVVYYDQRGCGASDYKPGAGYSLDQAVADLDGLRKALKIDRWVVLGHSYGGLLAQCYAVKHPESMTGLVLVGSSTATAVPLDPTRQFDYLSPEERRRIGEIHRDGRLSMAQNVYNAFLNGDWKRQNYYKPSQERFAQIALYEWKHDPLFRSRVGQDAANVDLSGAFEQLPVPTLIVEGKWDLTWNTDKPKKLLRNHPNAKLVMLDHSSHSPFDDEPGEFFATLKAFVQGASPASDKDLALWRERYAKWQAAQERSPRNLLRRCGWGHKSNEAIAKSFSRDWLARLDEAGLLLKTGFALYDVGRYEDALAVFEKMSEMAKGMPPYLAISLVWRGQMLDLLGRRDEAVAIYRQAAALNVNNAMEHSQFGMRYAPSEYAAERIQTPFKRIENRQED